MNSLQNQLFFHSLDALTHSGSFEGPGAETFRYTGLNQLPDAMNLC